MTPTACLYHSLMPPPQPLALPARRALRALLRLLVGGGVALALLLGAAWWYGGRDGSLAWAVQRLGGWLPAGHSLHIQGVEGTLRSGGYIGVLRWQGPSMAVEWRDVRVAWQLSALLARRLPVNTLEAGAVVLSPLSPGPDAPVPPASAKALESLVLPLALDVAFDLRNIRWQAAPALALSQLRGRYVFTDGQHQLDLTEVRWEHGRLQAALRLQGNTPMALHARLQGTLQAPALADAAHAQDGSNPVPVQLRADLDGTLAGPHARVDVALHTSAPADTDGPAGAQAMRAEVRARIHPWQPHPVEAVQAQFHQLDVAAFWPQGPHTRLDGQLQAAPLGPQGWHVHAQLHNAMPGPWDRQRLPLEHADAALHYDGQRWNWQNARFDTGGGHIRTSGHYSSAGQGFASQVQWQGINPAALHTRLPDERLQGHGQVSMALGQPVEFSVDAQGSAGAQPRLLQKIAAQGHWQAPLLLLHTVQFDALQASVRASDVRWDSQRYAAQGSLRASVPGVQAAFAGHISAAAGQGRAHLALPALPALAQWLGDVSTQLEPVLNADVHARLSALAQALPQQAQARLDVDWHGGWGGLQWPPNAAAGQGGDLHLNATLQVPELHYQMPGATVPLQWSDVHLTLQGTPGHAHIDLRAQARRGAQSARLTTAGQAGLRLGAGAAPDWFAHIERLHAELNPGGEMPGAWQVQLDEATPLHLSQTTVSSPDGAPQRSYRATAASVHITAPAAAQQAKAPVRLDWDASEWAHTRSENPAGHGADTRTRAATENHLPADDWALRSSGRITALPLGWADAIASLGGGNPASLAALGLGGDLRFNARWDIHSTRQTPHLALTLERAAGDLRLTLHDDASVQGDSVVSAGIEQARLHLAIHSGAHMQARLDYHSAQAGHISAELGTPLRADASALGWHWPGDAPLSGHVNASLPNIGVWSLFAPPGWRVGGSLQARADIAGTRQQPQWQGTLQADDFSIASPLDGVDLNRGTLRARLQGTRLRIDELRLQGSSGSSAHITGPSGNRSAAAQGGGHLIGHGEIAWNHPLASTSGASATPSPQAQDGALTIDLQAQAQQLQILARADRQLSLSGTLQARMQHGQVSLRGDLRTDRAAIIAHGTSAPTLDADVSVHSSAERQARQQAAQQAQRRAEVRPHQAPDIHVTLDLGPDFALQGYGITTRLAGQLHVRSAAAAQGPARIEGEIRTEQGRYRAWGQTLDVESGIIRFSGAYDNPALDILALRPNIPVRAGVHIQGTASAPSVRLYAEPELPDAEKLAWILTGRDPASGGAPAALLQQAALALLSGGRDSSTALASRLGLDEIGLQGGGEGEEGEGAALSLGKRLSNNLYVTYEQSLSGAMGTLYIFYDLTRSLTLRGQTGENSALDLIYTVRRN